jgi:hypothetical protein
MLTPANRHLWGCRRSACSDAGASPHGPPILIKPSHELFGEILLPVGRSREDAEQFATALSRHKNRARPLLGAARAAARGGDMQGAANTYRQFTRQWQQADTQLPELREARTHAQ